MKLIRPFTVTAANLTSNVAEDGTYPEYAVTATYALGAIVIETVGPTASHHAYESLVAGNIGNPLTNAAKWLDLGATNRFAMFDQSNGSATTNATSIDASVAVTGRADGLALLNLDAQTVDVTMTVASAPHTNLLTFSEQFDNAAWTKGGVSVTANAGIGLDGAMTAERVSIDATSGEHRFFQSAGSAAQHAFSIYAKAETASFISISTGTTAQYATFNLADGTVAASNGGVGSTQSLGNGWYRLILVGTTAMPASFFVVNLGETQASAQPGAGSTGTNKTVLVWGAQLEAGLAASAYIQTTTASITTSISTVFSKRFNLQSDSGVSSWYDYFSEEIIFATDLVLTDLPLYTSPVIRAVINKTGTAACGNMVVGQGRELGDVVYGARVGIADYSRKTVDDFGNYTLVERSFAKRTSFKMVILNTQIDQMQTLLAGYRATPVMWIGTDQYAATWVFGFYKDFSIEIAFVEKSNVTLEIEGLT